MRWKLIHLDLAKGLDTISTCEGYCGVRVYCWWAQYPLAELQLRAHDLPLAASSLRDRVAQAVTLAVGDRLFEQGFKATLPILYPKGGYPVDPLPALDRLKAMVTPLHQLKPHLFSTSETISVIVCTRDRPEALSRCLQALVALDPAPAEILVVDNAPAQTATRELVSRYPQIRYLVEPEPGLSRARNRGALAARGQILAYTDDDVQVHPAWIAGLQQGFADSSVAAVTGLMLPLELTTEAQVYFQDHLCGPEWGYRAKTFGTEFFTKMLHRGVPVWMLGAGANMAFRRSIFEVTGLFDVRLGAGASGCSEDSELWYRILAVGGTCRYEPSAVVFHEHRRTFPELRSQIHHYMRGHVVALVIQFRYAKHWGNLRRLGVTLPRYYLLRIVRILLGKRCPSDRLLFPELTGFMAGIVRSVFG